MSRKKQEPNYSLFFGVVATLAATIAKKTFFEEITSSEKVRGLVVLSKNLLVNTQ